ncbi:hypothetical protein Y032_0303g1877 [Ancylostoma ceylanicum]|uniref:Uncharacterized protein n=1 Tax=Ancylostoma ceylanicum TaxID=53326 RepID=A0A016S3C1_9BILA|nr:hypothetical protein Y032_0303g1877 [Ancylostoma ceylanicum]
MNAAHIQRNYLKASCWSILLATFVGVYLLVSIFQFSNKSLKNNNAAEERCLVGSLHAMGDGGGIGNVMFELVGLIAIAQEVKRIPVILDPSLLDRLNEISTYFPYIRSRFQRKSFKYFWNLGRAEVLRAVSGSERATFVATERLFPKNRSRRQQLNICVHARRGDFTDSTMHLPSSAEFTIAAMHFLIEKAKSEDSRSPHAYVFSDNVDWAEQNIIEPYLTTNASDVVPLVASNFIGKPPNAEWEFSRLYCDRVLLTGASSFVFYDVIYHILHATFEHRYYTSIYNL